MRRCQELDQFLLAGEAFADLEELVAAELSV